MGVEQTVFTEVVGIGNTLHMIFASLVAFSQTACGSAVTAAAQVCTGVSILGLSLFVGLFSLCWGQLFLGLIGGIIIGCLGCCGWQQACRKKTRKSRKKKKRKHR